MQSRSMSALEALSNVAIGWALALLTQILLFPVVSVQATLDQHLLLSAAFTVVSLIRSYLLRRCFNAIARADADGTAR